MSTLKPWSAWKRARMAMQGVTRSSQTAMTGSSARLLVSVACMECGNVKLVDLLDTAKSLVRVLAEADMLLTLSKMGAGGDAHATLCKACAFRTMGHTVVNVALADILGSDESPAPKPTA